MNNLSEIKRDSSDTISRQAAIDTVHKSIFDFFDICDDDEESPMTYKDKQLLALNKAITTQIKALPSAQPEIIRCKDCLMHGVCRFEQGLGLDGYCSQAERRTDERLQ